MFTKILIANRGEITCRIIRTARRLGIATVAVYSDADRAALHAALADEAFWIGPAPARDSYLDGGKILDAARHCGAEAIHPGYGFLAENADFAEACASAGIVFIGPPPAAMRALGDKTQAKALMEKAGVPLVPGYHGGAQDPSVLAEKAAALGFPVLIKAAAGGGGKGMKIASNPAAFGAELASARREAVAAFGDDRILLEKYLSHARHVEIQIFADGTGNAVHLFDRDCSMQRRHQKIIEEAPAPGLSEALRQAMREAALSAARVAGYIGAGTVEFLFSPDDDAFYFLEMNTRLQVEHPVTEMITGLDLVEWQFHIAAGGALPLRQEEIGSHGHTIEARIYAEDPARGFLPQAGRLARLDFPSQTPELRIDTGVQAGDTIPVDYDPMIAKVIGWGNDRPEAAQRLRAALGEIRMAGVTANLDLLRAVAADAAFNAGPQDTGFVERQGAGLVPRRVPAGSGVLALAVIGALCERADAAREKGKRSQDPWSPWSSQSGWRLNGTARETMRLHEILPEGKSDRRVEVTYLPGGWRLDTQEKIFFDVQGRLAPDGTLDATLDGHRLRAVWVHLSHELLVFMGGGAMHRFAFAVPAIVAARVDQLAGRLTAPMPGRIAALLAAPGERVEAGQPLLVLEAMKMEHMLRAPKGGILKEFKCKLGGQVAEGAELAAFEPAPPEAAT